jgi:hypothetical protein
VDDAVVGERGVGEDERERGDREQFTKGFHRRSPDVLESAEWD